MLRYKNIRGGHRVLQNQLRAFTTTRSVQIDLSSHNSVKDTIDAIDVAHTDPDFKSSKTFQDIISHHASRLESLNTVDDLAQSEYDDLYTLSLKLSKLLEATPEVGDEAKKQLLNNLIERFTKYNYAVSTLAFKKLLGDKQNLSLDAIDQLITHNPGRVSSSWDLYNTLKPETESHDQILATTMRKLLNGDPIEIRDDSHHVDIKKLIKILDVYSQVGDKDIIDQETTLQLLKTLVKLECTAVITQMAIPSSIFEIAISQSEDFELQKADYLYFYEASINNGVSLSGNSLLKAFMPISKLQLHPAVESENLKEVKEALGIQPLELAPLAEVVDEIREQIRELGLDDTPAIIMDLVKSAGFHSKDVKTAIQYFQDYQSRIPDGTTDQNNLKSTMSLVCVYDCIDKDDPKMVNVAEALLPQSPLPAANNLASLVLFHGWFANTDKAFDIYNKSLDLYMTPREGNEGNRGMLVESLLIVSLLGKEVGLAKLIKSKSLENKIIDDTYEIMLTNIFKEYGDNIEVHKDNEVEFRNAMKKVILRTISSFSP